MSPDVTTAGVLAFMTSQETVASLLRDMTEPSYPQVMPRTVIYVKEGAHTDTHTWACRHATQAHTDIHVAQAWHTCGYTPAHMSEHVCAQMCMHVWTHAH